MVKSRHLFSDDRALIVLWAVAIAVKIALATISAISYDFLFLLKLLIAGWMKSPVPYVLISGPFYQLWLALPFNHPNLAGWVSGTQFPPGPSAYVLVLMVKLPILVADVFCAILLKGIATMYSGRRNGLLAATVWLLNPYVLLTAEMDGSIELISITMMLAGILFLMKKHVGAGSFAFGTGIALKLFPIVLIPALFIYYYRLKKVRDLLKIAISALGGFIVYLAWTSAMGMDFTATLLSYTPFTTMPSEIMLTPYASKIGLATISALAFSFLLGTFWVVKNENITEVMSAYLLAYMAFYDWWPQYLLWLIPFMTVDIVISRRWTRLYYVLLLSSAFFFDLIMFEFASNISAFFIPTFTKDLNAFSALLRQVHSDVVMTLVFSPILRSIFAGVAVFYSAEVCIRNSPRLKALLCRTGCE
jgi:hypothetical protein